MLNKHRWLVWPIAVLAIAIWIQVGIESSLIPKYGDICTKNEYTGQKECATYHIVFVSLWYLAKFFDDHAGAIAALATVFIGFFTFTLYKATDQLKSISERQIQALTDLERPWIFIQQTHLERREDDGGPIIPNYFWISFVCKNVGRAPAIIEECFVKIHDKKTISKIPDYSEPRIHLRCPATVAVGIEFETSSFGPPSQPDIAEADVIFYVIFGKITYKELNGTIHHTGFSVEVSPHMAASTSHPNPAYDYYD